MAQLNKMRKEVDRIDEEIVEVLSKRFSVTKQIKTYKQKNKLPLFDRQRENNILKTKAELARKYGINPQLIKKNELIFKENRN